MSALNKNETASPQTISCSARLTRLEAELTALEMTQLRILSTQQAGSDKPDPRSSVLKLRGSTIQQEITENPVVLYMKGTPVFPQCGFSARVVQVLSHVGVPFKGVNVLADPELREGIKAFTNWPTIPQLYVKGEFVGGSDIITEMTLSGELDQLFDKAGVAYDKDAANKIREANA